MIKRIVSTIVALVLFSCTADNKILYLIPPAGYYGDKIFDMGDAFYNKDDQNRPFFNLREHVRKYGFDLVGTSVDSSLPNAAGLIVCDLPSLEKLATLPVPLEKRILLILEPPTVAPHYYDATYHQHFGKILTMIDDSVDNKKYFKLHYPQAHLNMIDRPLSFNDKKLCTLIAGNKYSAHPCELYTERKKIIRFFEEHALQDFDFYGFWWPQDQYPSYRGSALRKLDILNWYKFCICYENMRDVNGYITEKIFDAFKAGCVPVYWGAQNITDYIPSDCFIDRRSFSSDQELYEHLKSIDQETYERFLLSIKRFLVSEKAYCFSDNYFIASICRLLELPL